MHVHLSVWKLLYNFHGKTHLVVRSSSEHRMKPSLTSAFLLLACAPVLAQQTSADTLFAHGHYLRAQAIIQAELQKHPTDLHTIINASAIEWAFSHPDASIALAEKAVQLDTNSPEAHVQLTNALGTKLVSSNAGTFEKLSLARRFHQQAEHALTLSPNNPDAIEDMARFYWNAPSFAGGDKPKATQLADHLFQINPARGAALKASFLTDDKNPTRNASAIEALWQQAAAAQPNDYHAHIGLAAALFNQGPPKFPLAESEARKAIALDPSRIPAYRQLAILYATTARWDDLETILRRSRAAVPDDLSPQFQAARIILTQNVSTQLANAEQYLRAYLAQPAEGQEPTHGAARWQLGLVLEKQGRRADALHEIQTAVNQDPSLDAAKKDLQRLQ
jgi:hypothetical protein